MVKMIPRNPDIGTTRCQAYRVARDWISLFLPMVAGRELSFGP
ncbi:MAG TPA: hypothetical protein VMS89_00715 [Methanoregulaceae archaeon]|nr:hypothetical protein [Methanoregulaceae archaeon]